MVTVPAIALILGLLDLATISVESLRRSGAVRSQTPRSSPTQSRNTTRKTSPVTQRLVGAPVATISGTLHHLEHTLGLIVRALCYPEFPIDALG